MPHGFEDMDLIGDLRRTWDNIPWWKKAGCGLWCLGWFGFAIAVTLGLVSLS